MTLRNIGIKFVISRTCRHGSKASIRACKTSIRAAALLAGLLSVVTLGTLAASARERTEFNLSRQPGLTYLPNQLMEGQKLIEKHAEKLELKDLKVNYLTFTSAAVSRRTLCWRGGHCTRLHSAAIPTQS